MLERFAGGWRPAFRGVSVVEPLRRLSAPALVELVETNPYGRALEIASSSSGESWLSLAQEATFLA